MALCDTPLSSSMMANFLVWTAGWAALSSIRAFSPYADVYSKPRVSVDIKEFDVILAHEIPQDNNGHSGGVFKSLNQSYWCQFPQNEPAPMKRDLQQVLASTASASADSNEMGAQSEDDLVTGADGLAESENELESSLTTKERALELLEATLAGKCLFFHQDYWGYEMCYGRQVNQLHPTGPGTNDHSYILGVMADVDTSTTVETTDGSQYFVSQMYSDGTLCDLTSQPRSVEVTFKCNPNIKAPRILSVFEQKTCHYLMVTELSELCSEDAFREEDDSLHVTCRRIVESLDQDVVSSDSMSSEPVSHLIPGVPDVFKLSDDALAPLQGLVQINVKSTLELDSRVHEAVEYLQQALKDGTLVIDGEYKDPTEEFAGFIGLNDDDGNYIGGYSFHYKDGEWDVSELLDEDPDGPVIHRDFNAVS